MLKALILSIFLSFNTFASEVVIKGLGVNLKTALDKVDGRESAILDDIFHCMGKKYRLIKVPYGRHFSEFESNKYDFVTTIPENYKIEGFKSKTHMSYVNGFFLMGHLKNKVKSLDDLEGLRLITFKGASKLIPELQKIIPKLKQYKEHAQQSLHPKMLAKNRVDIVLSDRFIFNAYVEELIKNNELKGDEEFVFLDIFKHSPFVITFKKEGLRNEFNNCLFSSNGKTN